jgi:hypothetical protein
MGNADNDIIKTLTTLSVSSAMLSGKFHTHFCMVLGLTAPAEGTNGQALQALFQGDLQEIERLN